MKLYEVWRRSDWAAVANALQRHYPHDTRESLVGYQLVWEQMRQMESTANDYRLCADPLAEEDQHDPEDLPPGESPAHVFCRKADNEERYGIDFTPRSEVLGMEVPAQPHYQDDEMVAHILWEVTWHGFEEEDVQGFRDELLRRVDEIYSQTPEERAEQKRRSDEFMRDHFPDLWRRQQDD